MSAIFASSTKKKVKVEHDQQVTEEWSWLKPGTRVERYFPRSSTNTNAGWFAGTVKSVQKVGTETWIQTSFEDGDHETLEMGDIQREGVKRKFSGEDACHDDEDEKVADDANCVFVEHDISSSRIFQQNEIRSHKVPKGIPSNVCHVDQATPILQEEPAREQYFLKWKFKNRILICYVWLDKESQAHCFEKQLEHNGCKYSLVLSKMIENKGKTPKFASYERKMAKGYYFLEQGPEFQRMDLKSALMSLGDLSEILEPGKIASRLELLVSPTAWDSKRSHPLQFKMKTSEFKMIPEEANEGCGFAPTSFFEQYNLGTSPAVQVRIISPSMGWFKGMLVKKPSASQIELPPSMLKVEKCKTKQPVTSDNWVFLSIHQVFPSAPCKMMVRHLNPFLKNPPQQAGKSYLDRIRDKPALWNLLLMNGVPNEVLERYDNESANAWERHNHWSLVGVADPTNGQLPAGTVFLTGFGTVKVQRGRAAYFNLAVTRFPCTEKKDLVILRTMVSKPVSMSQDSWDFLSSLPFGLIIFGVPKVGKAPIPTTIADGDLDGDKFTVLWDDEIVQLILAHKKETPFTDVLLDQEAKDDDDLIGSKFCFDDEEGKQVCAYVTRKTGEDMYAVAVPGHPEIEMPRDLIQQDRDSVEDIIDHDMDHRRVKVLIKWSKEEIPVWMWVDKSLKKQIPGPLTNYAIENGLLRKPGWDWCEQHVSDSEAVEILDHRNQEVLVLYDDKESKWKLMQEMKEDSKDLLAKYCTAKGLEDKPEWTWVKKYIETTKAAWFERTQDMAADTLMLYEHDRLTTALHSQYKKCRETGNDYETMAALGQAFKESIDIRKHGGKVNLPIDLHGRITERALKKYLR